MKLNGNGALHVKCDGTNLCNMSFIMNSLSGSDGKRVYETRRRLHKHVNAARGAYYDSAIISSDRSN